MASIPLPALDVRPVQTPDALSQYSKVLQMKSLMGEQQMQQNQLQMQNQQLKDNQAITDAWKSWDGKDTDSLVKGVLNAGGSGAAANQVEQTLMARQTQKNALLESDRKLQQSKNDSMLGRLDAAESVPDEQLLPHIQSALKESVDAGDLDPQHAQGAQQLLAQAGNDPKAVRSVLDTFKKGFQLDSVQNARAKEEAETRASNAKAELDKANTLLSQNKADIIAQYQKNPQMLDASIDNIFAPNTPQNARYKGNLRIFMSQGDVDAAKELIKQAGSEKAGLEKEAYVQGAENVRQALNRQAQFSNELQKNGINQIEKMFTDPQHGYTQFLAQANATKNAIQDAKNGNEFAASMAPLMTVLGINSFAGIHRVNPQEAEAAGPKVGSIYRQINAVLDKAGSGEIQPDTAREMGGLIDGLIKAKHESLVPAAQLVATNSGIDPAKLTVMDASGKADTLVNVAKSSAPASTAQTQTTKPTGPPPGATHIVPGKDGHNHYTNATGTVDYGIAP
jgi:hypothetical protein